MSKTLKYTVTGKEYFDIYAEKYNNYTVIALTVGQQTSKCHQYYQDCVLKA